jgi:hypothetical protein
VGGESRSLWRSSLLHTLTSVLGNLAIQAWNDHIVNWLAKDGCFMFSLLSFCLVGNALSGMSYCRQLDFDLGHGNTLLGCRPPRLSPLGTCMISCCLHLGGLSSSRPESRQSGLFGTLVGSVPPSYWGLAYLMRANKQIAQLVSQYSPCLDLQDQPYNPPNLEDPNGERYPPADPPR